MGYAVETQSIRFTVTQFVITGENPLSTERTQRVLAPFLGEHKGLERLQAATTALEDALRARGHGFYRVILPPQALKDGAVQIQLSPLTVEKVTVDGNRHFSQANIRASVPMLKEGESPNTQRVSRALAVANTQAAKQTHVSFAASNTAGRIDANIDVQDKAPQQFYTWADNTGTEQTGRSRFGVGFQHGNLFDRDHAVTLSYATSSETEKIRQHGLNYTVPFYAAGGSLSAYYAKSTANSGTIAQFFDVKGAGKSLGASYTTFLAKRGGVAQRMVLGVDDKLFESDVSFIGTPIGNDVRSRPLTAAYMGTWEGQGRRASWHFAASANLSGGSRNDDASYAAARAGAESSWSLARAGASTDLTIRKWRLRAVVDSQITSEPLIPGEQFGVGGMDSVRGFEEREATGDRGWRTTFEVWAPTFKHNIDLLGFVEGGHVRLDGPLPGDIAKDSIASVGAGLRWRWRDRLQARLDYGYVTNGTNEARSDGARAGDNKLHAQIFYRF